MEYDFTPLFRSAIGFDRVARLAGSNASAQGTASYPPYNIEKTSDTEYALTMALAGFSPDDVSLTQDGMTLIVRGRVRNNDQPRKWLHRGIATRAFERRFMLADHIEIHSARLENGLLHISMQCLSPTSAAPRPIPIHIGPNSASSRNVVPQPVG
ncbi:Hsp20 family protein [Saccharibacter sp. 17.LH.SD]|uniref:Hsp20 family protein n=1 Tax=Saccharibacter sp. 17.LH.SD TaxID=2689393 RepID=UPI001367FCE1|nr:Hsp20 family protein [Saccharibacter sp. 17.LH.SD]MXV43557.1 Hsp20 family protein [Saccharibacter sp. 17.LH.SD]